MTEPQRDRQISFNPRLVLGFHLNEVKISLFPIWCKFGASLLGSGANAEKVFTNSSFYDIIKLVRYLIDKLEFDEEVIL